jgi:hypothetical protein
MQVLDDLELSEVQEVSVLEFCCEVSSMPYNRRTSRSLRDIIRQGKNTQNYYYNYNQCSGTESGSGSTGSTCFLGLLIRIH